MPTYSILRGVSVHGQPVEAVGAGFNRQLLTDLLRKNYGFKGVIVTDWSITMDCGSDCEFGAPAGQRATFADLGMPWGVEHLSKAARFSKAINAGVDQIGGSDEIDVMLAAVKRGYLSRSRLEQSAYRILLQKFQLGLFEDPYADEERANNLVGNASFVAQGDDAQRKSLVLLENKNHLLPYSMQGRKVYLSGLDPKVAASYGLVPVDSLNAADLAIIRAATPSELLHPSYALGRIQHEGRLDFRSGDSAYDLLIAASQLVPTIFIVEMNRPAILINVKDKATAVLASFGVGDKALLDLLAGKVSPQAHLPFELPSSMEEVLTQKEDLPHDSAHPLYSYGYGMTY
jgi:beta-glucosidase